MSRSEPLQTIRKQLREQLVEDLAAALKNLQALLPEQSEKYLLVISLLGRLNDANKARLRNTLSNDDLQREYDRIRADLLDLVQGLEEADFDAATAQPDGKPASRQGSVLYRVPHLMPLEKETRCVVRIALDEDAIVEDISIDEHVQLKSLYRVSDTMQAEIADPSGGRLFRIRSTSEPIQIIDKQGYTEWRFYVTPHVEGMHPLEIKVSIIEMKDGRPGKKELVLEETVQVVTEEVAPDAAEAAMKTADYTFRTSAPLHYAYEVTSGRTPARTNPALRALVFFLAFLVTGATATWAFTPADTWDWWMTPDTPKALQTFIKKHPESKHRDKAVRNLIELENKALAAISQDPNPVNIRAFLVDFPQSLRLEELGRLVDARQDLRQELRPAILQQIAKRNQNPAALVLRPSYKDIDGDGDLDLFVGEGYGKLMYFENQGTDSMPVWQMPDDSMYRRSQINPDKVVPPANRDSTGATPAPGTSSSGQMQKEPVTGEKNDRKIPSDLAGREKEPPVPDPGKKALKPDMVRVKGGTFKMGSETGGDDEKPVHEVALSDFYIGRYEVTFEEYDRFCDATGRGKPEDEDWGRGTRPVINVSWFDAVAYCNWLSKQEGFEPAYAISNTSATLLPGAKGYRLPTEAEWEYAARGGKKSRGEEYSGSNEVDDVAWYDGNSGGKTHPVGGKKENELGIFDLSGNVEEWCYDWYGDYPSGRSDNPHGPKNGSLRVLRGGGYFYDAQYCRAACRYNPTPSHRARVIGFRLAMSAQ
ncbi:MAG: SUMF1/EgtB/PvdO family nonheme iron enzyme [Saprospiraceae bacterium]